MPQVIVSRNEKEEVWVATPAGTLLAEGFFKAPDETPEELEHMGYPQLLHLYPPEEILVQTSSKHVGRICGVKSTHWNDDSHSTRGIEFVGVAPMSHTRFAWKCA